MICLGLLLACRKDHQQLISHSFSHVLGWGHWSVKMAHCIIIGTIRVSRHLKLLLAQKGLHVQPQPASFLPPPHKDSRLHLQAYCHCRLAVSSSFSCHTRSFGRERSLSHFITSHTSTRTHHLVAESPSDWNALVDNHFLMLSCTHFLAKAAMALS